MKTIYKVNLILVILMVMAISVIIVYKFYSEKIGLAVRSEETKNEYLLKDHQGNVISVTKEEWNFANNLEIAAAISGSDISGFLLRNIISGKQKSFFLK